MADERAEPAEAGNRLPVNPAWEIHPAEVRRLRAAGEEIVLVDVRNLREWDFCRIDGAVLAPLPELEARAQAELRDFAKKRVIVYCHHGVRSLRGAAILRHYGFENALSMAGGIEAWSLLVDPAVPRY